MKVAALDLGSNTFLLLVCDVVNGQITKIYQDRISVTKLGQGVHANKKFHPEALQRARECLKEFSQLIKIENPQKTLAMATSAARDVSNAQELFDIGKEYNIPIQIIPGSLEALVSFSGATYDLENKTGVCIIDVGGGSTEIIAQNEKGELEGTSVDVGSVRLTEMFVSEHPIKANEIEKIFNYVEQKFNEAKNKLPSVSISKVIGVAGTPTTLAAVMQNTEYSDQKVQNYKITIEQLEQWMHKLAALDLESRQGLVGMDPKRADVIVAGTIILIAALRALKMKELTVSIRGIRYGVALLAAKEGKDEYK